MSTVIKAGDARAVTGGALGLDLRDIATSADQILASARAQAEAIVREARRRAEEERKTIVHAAHADGYAAGLTEGRAAGEKAAAEAAARKFEADQVTLLTALTSLLSEFERRREQLYVSARRDVVVLAIAIASRIASKFAQMTEAAPQIAVEACAEALSLIREATEVVVTVHPDDAAAVSTMAAGLSSTIRAASHLSLATDPNAPRGSARVATADTQINGDIRRRIESIANELVDGWRERMAELNIEP